jgi:predicted RNA-binding protein with PUA-like domain
MMPSSWILKTEPSTYSWQDLVRDRKATWDGVANAAALMHLRAMTRSDEVLIYHSGAEKAIVGIGKILGGSYPDPKLDDPRRVVVDVAPVRPLNAPVPLTAIKADPGLAELGLVRISRLSCMPVSPAQRKALKALGVE